MPKVVMTLALPGRADELLSATAELTVLGEILPAERFREAIRGADALLPQVHDRIDEQALEAAGPQLRVVSNYAVGLDNVDVAACTRRGVMVGHTPEVLTDATADLAMTLLLATARRVVEGDREMRAGRYQGWSADYLLGSEVSGATLGLIGYGRIGRAVARRAAGGFRMRILAFDPHGVRPEPGVVAEEVSLERLLAESDFVSCHVPLGPSTRHLLGRAQFQAMRSSAILVNTSRGAVVDEAALVEALREGAIAGAGLDVYEHEPLMAEGLSSCWNATLAPHLGSATRKTREAMAEVAARNILEVFAGRAPVYCANPELAPTR